ncbi:MAG: hypothetical protein OXT64_15485 [Gammaproteobacteria bacterium]|nr:hypothetical protein [Gammaproteobacteria bacterium]
MRFEEACDETVPALGVMPHTPLPDELVEDGADGLVAGCGLLAYLALGERFIGLGEGLEDAPFGVAGLRLFAGRGRLTQAQEGFSAAGGEFDLDVVETGGAVGDDCLPARRMNRMI